MYFNSPEFLFVFLPVVFAGFYLLGAFAGKAAAISFLLLASMFFYAWWNPVYLPLFLASIVVNFFIGAYLSRWHGDVQRAQRSRHLLAAGIAANLSLLFYFKYAGFFAETVNALGGGMPHVEIALPLAISFFTFQKIAFLVDCARGRVKGNTLLNYATFVMFFPQLIAGPIVHYREMMPQLTRGGQLRPDVRRVAVGISILVIGLFKKVVIADSLSKIASPVFLSAEQGAGIDFFQAWSGALAYSFQIYFDFSGYSDMAVGLAFLFGIRLPLNFYSPYAAASIISFWRRWHMTLSRFLRDYLYIPLGGNRRGTSRRYVNLLLTMLLGGLWHGAGWTFVVWGLLHGCFLVINQGWLSLTRGRRILPQAVSRLLTFLCVVVAWVVFRAESFPSALKILSAMVSMPGNFSGHWALLAMPVFILFSWYAPNTAQIMRLARPCLMVGVERAPRRGQRAFLWRMNALWGAYIGILLAAGLVMVVYEPSKVFLYFQF